MIGWISLVARRLLQAPEPDPARAEQLLTPLLDHPPDDSFQCFLMVALVIGELPRLAVRTEPILRQAIALDPKDATPWHNLGNLLTEHFDRYQEAEAAYRQAIALDPKDTYPWNGLGVLHQTLHRDCEEAFRCFTKGLTRSKPESLEAAHLQLNLGRLELVRGRLEQARKALRRAFDLFDRQPGFQADALRLAVGLAGPTDPENGPRLVSETDHSAEESIPTLVERHTRLAREALERDLKSAAAQSVFIASLAQGQTDEALWQELLDRLETHQARFGFIDDLYLFAGLRPDTAPAAARRVAALLALPAEQVARSVTDPNRRTGWNATAPLPRAAAAAPAIPPTAPGSAAKTNKAGSHGVGGPTSATFSAGD